MSEASGCSGNCSSCSSKGSCSKPQSLLEPANHLSEVKKVIGIVSGKGGVGKSMVTSSLAVMMQRRGFSLQSWTRMSPVHLSRRCSVSPDAHRAPSWASTLV